MDRKSQWETFLLGRLWTRDTKVFLWHQTQLHGPQTLLQLWRWPALLVRPPPLWDVRVFMMLFGRNDESTCVCANAGGKTPAYWPTKTICQSVRSWLVTQAELDLRPNWLWGRSDVMGTVRLSLFLCFSHTDTDTFTEAVVLWACLCFNPGNYWNAASFASPSSFLYFPSFRDETSTDISFYFKTSSTHGVFLENMGTTSLLHIEIRGLF